MILINRLKNIM